MISIIFYLMESVTTCKYGAINTTDTKTMGSYVIKYVSNAFILQEGTNI